MIHNLNLSLLMMQSLIQSEAISMNFPQDISFFAFLLCIMDKMPDSVEPLFVIETLVSNYLRFFFKNEKTTSSFSFYMNNFFLGSLVDLFMKNSPKIRENSVKAVLLMNIIFEIVFEYLENPLQHLISFKRVSLGKSTLDV